MNEVKHFANLLNGRRHREEITKEEAQKAKEQGIVIVFGSSDDLMEFRGACYDEVGCYEGGEVWFTKDFKFPDDEAMDVLKEYGCAPKNKIEALWCEDGNEERDATWTYKTSIPHETFLIKGDDEENYCVGIVFHISSLH